MHVYNVSFFFKKFFLDLFMSVSDLFACICVHVPRVHAWCPQRSKEGVKSPETGIKDD